jgi:capsular polysaccharide transport system permease protein
MVQGSQVSRSPDDSYAVIGYMLSRDAMRQLEKEDDLANVLNRPESDFLWRYPGWLWSANEEHLYKHYLRFVSVSYDSETGICTLDVQASRPDDAQKIADALLGYAEALINQLNVRAQNDAIETANREVVAAKVRARAELEKLTAFRDRERMIDPTRVSTEVLDTIAKLSLEEAEANAQLAEMLESSPDSPQISTMRLRIAALNDQIDHERAQLAGADGSMAPLVAEYERLDLERKFADKTFESALNLLESAKLDAMRQRLYLDRITNPVVPDYANYPYRLTFMVVIFVLSYMVYRISRSMMRDVFAHAIP